MQAGTEQAVALEAALPVDLAYSTAWEENDRIRIGDDVYKDDAKRRATATAP
jgi:murein L,D-transpeptidase YcbB/YkuD